MIRVKLLPPLTKMVGIKEFEASPQAQTVHGVLEELKARFPQAGKILYEKDGSFSQEFLCTLNGDALSRDGGLLSPVRDGDELILLLPISGGSS